MTLLSPSGRRRIPLASPARRGPHAPCRRAAKPPRVCGARRHRRGDGPPPGAERRESRAAPSSRPPASRRARSPRSDRSPGPVRPQQPCRASAATGRDLGSLAPGPISRAQYRTVAPAPFQGQPTGAPLELPGGNVIPPSWCPSGSTTAAVAGVAAAGARLARRRGKLAMWPLRRRPGSASDTRCPRRAGRRARRRRRPAGSRPIRLGAHGLAADRTWVPAMVPWRATEDGFVTPTCSTGTAASPRAGRACSSSRRPASATCRAGRCCASATTASSRASRRLVETVRERERGADAALHPDHRLPRGPSGGRTPETFFGALPRDRDDASRLASALADARWQDAWLAARRRPSVRGAAWPRAGDAASSRPSSARASSRPSTSATASA